MVSFARAARRLILPTALACANTSTSFVAAASEPTGSGWRSDLNWSALESQLSPSASLIDTSIENYVEECLPEFSEESSTNHALINQEHGVCMCYVITAWDLTRANMTKMNQDYAFNGKTDVEPSYNLPSKVLFPSVASDVIHAIQFAEKHHLEISIKNSGHSFSGASTKKDTLLLNMNQYTHYAPSGITDCDPMGTTVADDLSNQACVLALARNKSNVIRVGGGENWDKVYRAVIAANKALEKYKYHIVGGAAGTVSPMGWTWQGGNAGTTGDRLYGKGVDQVLQVEMGLPNGYHVKFGPTEWEDASAEGFAVPRTKVVSGVCRSNPEEQDEEKWIWDVCPEDFDVDFMDLWFAVRGGGGGTYGVVTSVFLQLHEYLPYNVYEFSPSVEECSAFLPKLQQFQAKYFMAPSLLNVTKEMSLACGSAGGVGLSDLHCYGEEGVMQAWTNFLELSNSTEAVACLLHSVDSSSDESPRSYPEASLMDENSRFPGKVEDDGLMWFPTQIGTANVLVPQPWVDESEENIDILLSMGMGMLLPYYAYGVATSSFSDQANSLPQSLRDAATMANYLAFSDELRIVAGAPFPFGFWSDLFPKMYDISDKTMFPAVFQANHATFGVAGPRKDDWTKYCPWEWTLEERKEKCISGQEAIYGTEVLRRLEAIKLAVDPGFMFNCTDCIGNNLDLAKTPEVEVPPVESVAASFASTYAAAIFATVLYFCLSLF